MAQTKSGGCQCGAVRYQAEVEPDEAYLCHCRMCQRATGGVSIAFVSLKKTDRQWSKGKPDYFKSSPIARRPYCRKCGTPLGFDFEDGEYCDLTIGSFDDPSDFKPKHHFGVESLHEAWIDTSDLPRKRADHYKPLVDRWMNATGKIPD